MDDRIAPIVFAMRQFNPMLTDEEVKMVTDQLVLKSYKKNDYFIREGQVPKEIGFCVKGAFRQFSRKQDKEVNCNFMLEYDFLVAYASMLRHEPSRYYIQALEDCE
ncbi:MAG: cyclic nucleotide-binding domain-containing protein, partial [Cyclobacteriaceae bacterium]|nr:cyclic nucleotide-binding domain-containing protein [Cyclobacteriaceae bacterium]